jgi:hypothetical protein
MRPGPHLCAGPAPCGPADGYYVALMSVSQAEGERKGENQQAQASLWQAAVLVYDVQVRVASPGESCIPAAGVSAASIGAANLVAGPAPAHLPILTA